MLKSVLSVYLLVKLPYTPLKESSIAFVRLAYDLCSDATVNFFFFLSEKPV